MAFLQTDTAAQSALAQQFGDTVTAARGTAAAFLEEVQALQGSLVGSTGTATQAKAQHLNEAITALLAELDVCHEKVASSSQGYVHSDESGAGAVSASAGMAF